MKKLIPIFCLFLFLIGKNIYSQTTGTLTASPSPVIAGNSITFTVNGSTGVGFVWFKFDGNSYFSVNGGSSNSYTFTASGTSISMYCMVIQNGGSSSSNTNTVNVTVTPAFSPGIISTANTMVCPGTLAESLYFSTPPSYGSGSYTYQWQYKNDNIPWSNLGVQPTCAPSFNMSTKTSYKCLVNGVETNTVVVDVANYLNQNIQADQIICYGTKPNPLTQNSIAGGKEPFIYNWQYSKSQTDWNIITSSGTNSSYSPEILNETNYFRRIVQDACGQKDTSDIVTVAVRNEVIPIIRKNDKVCKYSTMKINVADTFQTYKWFDENMSVLSDNDTLKIGPFTNPISYYFLCTDKNNCTSDTIEVPIDVDMVKADFVVNKYELLISEEQKFINKSSSADSYKWFLNPNDDVFTEESPSNYYYTPGFYDITLIAISEIGCSDTLVKTNVFKVIEGSEIKDFNRVDFHLYPQPVIDFLNVVIPENNKAILSIYTYNGQKLKELIINELTTKIDVSDLSEGIYIVKVKMNTTKESTQIMIKK